MLVWVVAWGIWIAVLAVAFPFGGETLKSFLNSSGLVLAVPVLVLSLFADDLGRLRLFALIFIATTVGLALHAVVTWSGSLLFNLFQANEDLTWTVGYFNYHWFARTAAISVVLALTLLVDPALRTRWKSLLLMPALAFSVGFIVWSGSKQTLYTSLMVLPAFVVWLSRGRLGQRIVAIGTLVTVLTTVGVIFNNAPAFIRYDSLASGLLGDRPEIYAEMWEWFLRSPIWGNGLLYVQALSHNLFLDALAAQGIIGFVFLVGFLLFVLRYARGTWFGSPSIATDVWRMTALVMLVLSLFQAQISGSVFGSPSVYWAGVLIWRLHAVARHARGANVQAGREVPPPTSREWSRTLSANTSGR
jgi:O-antigen ligase